MDLWTTDNQEEIQKLETFIQEQRNQLAHLRNAAKACKIDETCSKEELDEWIDILVSLEDSLSYSIADLSSLTSDKKDGNLLNDNKDKKTDAWTEAITDNAYFHTDASTTVRVEVFQGKTESNLGELQLDAFPMEMTEKRIKLSPNTMGIIKLHIDSSIKLFKKEKTNGGWQTASDAANFAIDAITAQAEWMGIIDDVGDIDRPNDKFSYKKIDSSSLKGQVNVKYTVNELGEVKMEILDEIIDQKKGKQCQTSLSRFVDTSNLGVVKLKGEVASTGDYKSSESFEYTLEAYSHPMEKEEIIEVELPEETITSISSICEVYFEIDKHELDNKELKKLKQWIIALSKDTNWKRVLREKRAHIEIIGYASPPASEEYNEKLGKKRADFVWKSLKNQLGHEVDSEVSSIGGSIKSYGEYDENNQQQKVVVTITEIITEK